MATRHDVGDIVLINDCSSEACRGYFNLSKDCGGDVDGRTLLLENATLDGVLALTGTERSDWAEMEMHGSRGKTVLARKSAIAAVLFPRIRPVGVNYEQLPWLEVIIGGQANIYQGIISCNSFSLVEALFINLIGGQNPPSKFAARSEKGAAPYGGRFAAIRSGFPTQMNVVNVKGKDPVTEIWLPCGETFRVEMELDPKEILR